MPLQQHNRIRKSGKPALDLPPLFRLISLREVGDAVAHAAALEDEGFGEFGSDRLVESFARHLMTVLDAWQEHGFGEAAKGYLQRLPLQSGMRGEIAENGDLLIHRMTEPAIERVPLLP